MIHYLSAERDLVARPASPPLEVVACSPSVDRLSTTERLSARRFLGSDHTALDLVPGDQVTRGASSECGSLQSVRFQPLTGTLQEVRDLSRLWDR